MYLNFFKKKGVIMKEKLLDENIDRLNISCKLIELLKDKKLQKYNIYVKKQRQI